MRQQRAQHPGGVLVVEDRDDRDQRGGRPSSCGSDSASAATPSALWAPSSSVSGSCATTCRRPGHRDRRGRRARPRSSVERRPGTPRRRRARARSCAAGRRPARRPRRPGRPAPARAARRGARRPRCASSSASGCRPAPTTSVAPSRTTAELLARDVAHGRPEPARVLEPDARQHLDRRGDHVRRVPAAAEPGLDHRHVDLARGQLGEGGGGQRLELRDAVVRGRRAVDERGGVRGALDRARERARLDVAVVDADPFGERDEVRRQVGADAQPVALRGSRRSSAPSRTCRSCRRRGSCRSGARAGRASSSAGACGRARSACRTARARAGSARRPRAIQRAAAAHSASSSARSRSSFVALGLDDGRRRLRDEALVRELALAARAISASSSRAARRACARPRRGRRRRWRARSTAPPGIAIVAASAAPLARRRARSARAARRARPSARSRRRSSRAGDARAGRRADAVAPAAQRLHGVDRVAERALGVVVARRRRPPVRPAAPRAGPRRPARTTRSPRSRTGSPGARAASVSVQHVQQRRVEVRALLALGLVEARLDELEVPVAQLAVDEVVERERGVREVEARRCAPSIVARARCEAREDPAVLDRARASAAGARLGSDARAGSAARRSTACSPAAGPAATFSSPSSARPAGGHRQQAEAHARRRRAASISSSGSMPVPSDFYMRRPSGAWMTEWM